MSVLRDADCYGRIPRCEDLQREKANTEAAKQERRDLNRRLAEKLVAGWSALEYRERRDDELARALDGQHDGTFDVNAAKYRTQVAERRAGGSDVDVADARAATERKRREAQFVSVQLGTHKGKL